MTGRRPNRLIALLLTALFVGSGFALPDLDALLYHSHRVSPPADVGHVDLPGGCGAHAERCALTLMAPLPQIAPATSAVRALGLAPERSPLRPVVAPPSTYQAFLHPSRAPPAAAS
jgi:hypothetical protein